MLLGKALYPLADLIPLADFPLAELIPADSLQAVFDRFYYSHAVAQTVGDNLVLDVTLEIEGEIALSLPGSEAFAIVLAYGGPGWSTFRLHLVIGPQFEFSLRQVTLGLRVSPDVLKDVATGGPSVITVAADCSLSASGLRIDNFVGPTLQPAYVAGTEVIVSANDVRPVFSDDSIPEFLDVSPGFRGLALRDVAVQIPSRYLQTPPGAGLDIRLEGAGIGTTGFTGRVRVESANLVNPVRGTLFGFPFRFSFFELDIRENAILALGLEADVRLEAFEDGPQEKWVRIGVAWDGGGEFSASLTSVQPPEAGSSANALITLQYPNVLRIDVKSLRIARDDQFWAVYVGGDLQLLVSGAVQWPKTAVEEVGVRSDGKFLLPDGAGIAFSSPLVVNWHFVRLSVTKFRLGYADVAQQRLQLGISAEVLLLEGLPAGVSVEGLVVEWEPGANIAPTVSLSGIGVELGVPGSFHGKLSVAFVQSPGNIEFRGQGSLELTALDMGIQIGVVVGHQSAPPPAFTYLYLFADAKLLPTGIPIAQTGVSIYGFQGLIAYNMALKIDLGLPEDERFYELFTRAPPPPGITDISKWEKRRGQNALGVGIVLGTADKGFALNVKGLLVVAFPDITILLQARANFIKIKPDLGTDQEGTLDALLVYASGQGTLSLDVLAHWSIPVIVTVDARARAFFSFNNPRAWYVEIGRDEDGKRSSAHVLEWNGSWLFTAGFWFRLDMDGVVTGVQIELELRKEAGGFFVEVYGFARGDMALYWQPAQFEGGLAQRGRIAAGYRGVSIGIELGGLVRAKVKNPYDLRLEVEACVRLLFRICKTFKWHWEHYDPPPLEAPIRRWAAIPRHWTPVDSGGASPALDTGTVQLDPGGVGEPVIPPHSVLAMDFAKAMGDSTQLFNEAVTLDDGGFMTIGRESGWSAAFRVDSIVLRQVGNANSLMVWGTWARETLLPNTTLRIGSSQRFAHQGSLTESFAESMDLDYCDPPVTTRRCVPLVGLQPGYGYLDDGTLYHFDGDAGETRPDSSDGTVLKPGESIELIPRGPNENPTATTTPVPPTTGPALSDWWKRLCERNWCRALGVTAVLALVALVLAVGVARGRSSPGSVTLLIVCIVLVLLALLLLWFCHCRRDTPIGDRPHDKPGGKPADSGGNAGGNTGSGAAGNTGDPGSTGGHSGGTGTGTSTDTGAGTTGGGTTTPISPTTPLVITNTSSGDVLVTEYCYDQGHSTPVWSDLAKRGGTITQNEEWTVPADMKLLPPNSRFELEARYTAQLKAPDGTISTPLGVAATTVAKFRTGGPPTYRNALHNLVRSLYPDDGARPVYYGYDLRIVFVEDYVPYLYSSVGQRLLLRLFDAQGAPVLDSNGQPAIVPATTVGPDVSSRSEEHWENIYQREVARGCVAGPPVRTTSNNTFTATPGDWQLTPNSVYTAWLVSNAAMNVPLHEWTFTTSRFSTFAQLATTNRELRSRRTHTQIPAGSTFDAVARSAGMPTIAYVDHFTVTALTNANSDACYGLLLEAPEPLEAPVRLSATVQGQAAPVLVANADTSRVWVLPSAAAWGATPHVELTWKRDAGTEAPRLSVAGVTSPEILVLDLDLGALP